MVCVKPMHATIKKIRWFSGLLSLVQGHRWLEPRLAERGYSGSAPWTGRTHSQADAHPDNSDATVHLTHTPLGRGRKQVPGDDSTETRATARNWLFLHQRYNETALKKWHYSRTLLHWHDPLHVLSYWINLTVGIDTVIFSPVFWMRKLKHRKASQLVHNTAPPTSIPLLTRWGWSEWRERYRQSRFFTRSRAASSVETTKPVNSHLVTLQGALVSLLCPENELNATTKQTSPERTRDVKFFHFIRNDS